MLDKNIHDLLALVSIAVTGTHLRQYVENTDWDFIANVSNRQNIMAFVLDAIGQLPAGQRPPKPLLLQWIGQTTMMERMYAQHRERVASLAALYARHGIRMLLLKGYGCSLCWPKPEYRPMGDIDIYLFGWQDKADTVVEHELGIRVHREYHKHSTFEYEGVEVENHAKFIDDVSHKSNIRFEQTLMSLLSEEDCIESPVNNVLLPPPTFSALFLLRHTGEHFASNEITLRHVLDVGTFFMKYHSAIDWKIVMTVYQRERMMDFFNGIATICVEYLGVPASCFASADGLHSYSHNKALANRILADIFEEKECLPMTTMGIDTVGKTLRYAVAKSRRWWRNRWKYRLVYNESLVESFVWLARNRMDR